MKLMEALSQIYFEHYEEKTDTLFRYYNGESIKDRVCDALNEFGVPQIRAWDNVNEEDNSGVTSIAFVTPSGELYMETYSWVDR